LQFSTKAPREWASFWDYEIEIAKAKGGGADYGKRLDKETMAKIEKKVHENWRR
jgi:hypothetical protein